MLSLVVSPAAGGCAGAEELGDGSRAGGAAGGVAAAACAAASPRGSLLAIEVVDELRCDDAIQARLSRTSSVGGGTRVRVGTPQGHD